jgi:membrane protease YdiL (CAAX protease family)
VYLKSWVAKQTVVILTAAVMMVDTRNYNSYVKRIAIMIKKFSDRTPIIFSFVTTILILAVFSITQSGFADLFGVDITDPVPNANSFTASLLVEVLFSGLVMLILVMLKMPSVNNPFKKGFFKGLGLGWFFILAAIVSFAFFFDFSKAGSIEQSKWLLLIPFFFVALLTGVFEELMCRGILYNVINNKYKLHAAVLLSAAIFGVVHFINLISQSLAETAVQVLFAFGAGVLFAAVYARCKTVWAGVLLHGLVNFSEYAATTLAPVEQSNETLIAIFEVVFAVAAICIGLYLIRKKKTADIMRLPCSCAFRIA